MCARRPFPHLRQLTFEDLARLPYLNAVIDETMRLYPVAATGSVRCARPPPHHGWTRRPRPPWGATSLAILSPPTHTSRALPDSTSPSPLSETAAPARVGPYTLPPGVVVWPMIYALQVPRPPPAAACVPQRDVCEQLNLIAAGGRRAAGAPPGCLA